MSKRHELCAIVDCRVEELEKAVEFLAKRVRDLEFIVCPAKSEIDLGDIGCHNLEEG